MSIFLPGSEYIRVRAQPRDPVGAGHVAAIAAPIIIRRQQREFGAVGVEARDDIEHLAAVQPRRLLVADILGQQMPGGVQGGNTARILLGMDFGIDVEAGLVRRRAGPGIGQREEPDLPALEGSGERPQRRKFRIGGHQDAQPLGQFVASIVAVAPDI
jgi:hypothetical protein